MFTLLRTSCLLLVLVLTVSAASEENVTKQIDATPGGRLIVDVEFGAIDVTPGTDNQVALEAHRKLELGDQAREKEYLSTAPLTVTKDGDVITVRARSSKPKSWWNSGHSKMTGRYALRVPKKFETDLHTDRGDVSVGELTGSTTVKTDAGKLAFKRVEGVVNANTSGGSIEVEDCRGPVKIETSGGDITVANGTGTLDAETSGGRIDVRNFSGDTIVKTSGGNLELQKISGKIAGKTSGGSIHAAIPAGGADVNLQTGGGNIDLSLPVTAAADIDASAMGGKVFSSLPLEASDVRAEHLRGKLNGGGNSVKLETSAGTITIRPSSSEVVRR